LILSAPYLIASTDRKKKTIMSKITFEEAAAKAIEFRNERDWKQFHNPKDLAISISLESSELLELFQWSGTDLEAARKKPEMTEELADVMIYCIYMANALNIDIPEAIQNKIDKNAAKYPVEKAKGKSKKYTEL
jgi:NTP pyrophosphatase (non-canonical NTP hydrolase)